MEIPKTPEDWVGDKNRISSFFHTWWTGTPRARALLLYGNPGCGKTSSVYAFGENSTIIHRNCSSEGGIAKINEIYEISQSTTDIDGNKTIILLDEIEGLTHKSMEIIPKIIKNTKVPIIMTCNMDSEEINSIISKYKWGNDIDIFEVKYPEDEVADVLNKICIKTNNLVDRSVLETIASSCNSVRSSILTLHRYINKGKLGKIIPIDIQGSTHEQIRKLFNGEKQVKINVENNKFLDYCLSNKVPAHDIENHVILTWMARQKRLGGIDEMFMNNIRASNIDIYAPRIKAKAYFFRPKTNEKKKEEKEEGYKKSSLPKLSIRKKKEKSLNDIW